MEHPTMLAQSDAVLVGALAGILGQGILEDYQLHGRGPQFWRVIPFLVVYLKCMSRAYRSRTLLELTLVVLGFLAGEKMYITSAQLNKDDGGFRQGNGAGNGPPYPGAQDEGPGAAEAQGGPLS